MALPPAFRETSLAVPVPTMRVSMTNQSNLVLLSRNERAILIAH